MQKPVTDQELFYAVSYSKLALVIKQTCYFLVMDHRDKTRQICRTGLARLDLPKPDHQKVVLGLDSASESISPHCCDT